MNKELSANQRKNSTKYVDIGISIGSNTDRFDYDKAIDIIHDLQEHVLEIDKTPVIIYDNPLEAWVACNYVFHKKVPLNKLNEHVDFYFDGNDPRDERHIILESFSTPYFMGSLDSATFCLYDFYNKECDISFEEVAEKYEMWKRQTELGMIYMLDDVTIVAQKPTHINTKYIRNEPRLHSESGPAIAYAGRGDLKIFALNGIVVPEWLAVTHSSKIPISRYTELENADVKMEFVKKVGVERMLETGKMIDSYKEYPKEDWWNKSEYELWDMSHLFEGVEYAPHLKMKNQSTATYHVEAVHPRCRNLKQALKFRFGGKNISIQKIS